MRRQHRPLLRLLAQLGTGTTSILVASIDGNELRRRLGVDQRAEAHLPKPRESCDPYAISQHSWVTSGS